VNIVPNLKRSPQQITCEEALKRVFDFIDEQLKGTSRAELEHHLETCRHCYDRVEFEKLVKSRLRTLQMETDSTSLKKKINSLLETF
jgi:mycothiol system anti-sigma-R factor